MCEFVRLELLALPVPCLMLLLLRNLVRRGDQYSLIPYAVQRVDLLLLLLGHELDRINVWGNPQGKPDHNIIDNGRFTALRTISQEEWHVHAETAWNMDPRIAVNLYYRFRLVVLRNEIEHLVSVAVSLAKISPLIGR